MTLRGNEDPCVDVTNGRINKHSSDSARHLPMMLGMRADDSWAAHDHADDRHHSFFYDIGDRNGTSTFRAGSLQGRRTSAALLIPNASGSLRVALSIGETSAHERDRILKWAELAEAGATVQVSDGEQIVPLGAVRELKSGKGGLYLRLALGAQANGWLYVGLDQARELRFPQCDGEHGSQYSQEWLSVFAAMLCLQANRPRSEGSDRRFLITGSCPQMQQVLEKIERFGKSDLPILIHGESGTGKELVAKSLHFCSRRAREPFIALNCGGLRGDTLHSELFGHKKGAFTGAVSDQKGKFTQANGGTIFLDEIGDMPLETQKLLLRALQERTAPVLGGQDVRFDVRLICATHKSLSELMRSGKFREDLYYRVKGHVIELPPLRERGEDILELADVLLERWGSAEKRPTHGFTPDARAALSSYPWPGNVRELEHAVHKGLVNAAPGSAISVDDLELSLPDPAIDDPLPSVTTPQRPSSEPLPTPCKPLNEARFRRFATKFISSLQSAQFDESREAMLAAVERALRPNDTRGRSGGWIAVARELLGLPLRLRGRDNQLSVQEAAAFASRIMSGVTGEPSIRAVVCSAAMLLHGSDHGIYDLVDRVLRGSSSERLATIPPNSGQVSRDVRADRKGHML